MTTFADLCGRLCADLIASDDETGSNDEADSAYEEFEARLPDARPAELSAAMDAVTSRLDDAGLARGQQAVLIGARLVEAGAPAAPLMRIVEPMVVGGLSWAANFPVGWELASYGADLPWPEDDEVDVDGVLGQLKRNLERAEMTEEEAEHLTEAWFSVNAWMQALLAAAQPADGRAAMTAKDDLIEALAPINDEYANQFSTAYWLTGILDVLDDEPLVVLHRETGRGYRLTIGGIADNYQLHTLLADRLIGDPGSGLIYEVRPEPEWVAAASTGEDLEPAGGIRAQFRLVDAYGEEIFYENHPAEIPELDGVRVVVLDRLPHPRSWNAGRVFQNMAPTVRLDAVMPPDEAAQWISRLQA